MIPPGGVILLLLLLLSGLDSLGNHSLLPLHFAVGKDLLSSKMLLLQSPQLFLFSLCFLQHFLFVQLLVSFVQDCLPLLLVKALEVVGLDSVGSQHRLLSGWVLGHEVVVLSEVNLVSGLEQFIAAVFVVGVTLVLSHLGVGISTCLSHFETFALVILLGLRKDVIEVSSLVVDDSVSIFIILLVKLFLPNLLLNPVGLL